MKRHWIETTLGVAAALAVTACGAARDRVRDRAADTENGGARNATERGPVEERSFALGGFTGVSLGGADSVVITRGDAFSVTAKGHVADLDDLDIVVKGQDLQINRKKNSGWSRHRRPVALTVTLPVLHNLALGGSGRITADRVGGSDVNVSLGGSGTLDIAEMTSDSASFAIGGSGSIKVAGTAGTGKISIGGSGNVDAARLRFTGVKIVIAGSGNVTAHASGTADIMVTGSGDVAITGGAKCNTRRLGSGRVTCT